MVDSILYMVYDFWLYIMNELIGKSFMYTEPRYNEISYHNLIFITIFFMLITLSKMQPGL